MPKVAPKTQPRPKPKQKQAKRPTLPQHNLPAPYDALLSLGEQDDAAVYEATAAHIRAHDTRAGVEQLVQMALDESYYEYLDEKGGFDDPRANTRLHAVRTLMRLKEAAQPAIAPLLPLLNEEDDWLREEMPLFYAVMGSPAIEPLTALLKDAEADSFARAGAGDSLAEMTEQHPELRSRVLPLLEEALSAEPEDETLRSFLIINLMDIGARESLPLIELAFAEDKVDLSIVQMIDVQEHFGLPLTSQRVPIRWNRGGEEAEDEYDFEEDDPEAMIEDGEDSQFPLPVADDADFSPQTPYVAPPKVGRNEPCPCGSGKKFKKCCGA